MTANKVHIINYGMGNLHSVARKLKLLGADVHICSSAHELLNADRIILPGVGHFAKAMQNLHQQSLSDALNEAVLIKKTPVLGICLGMQLMCNHSEEGDCKGLGWIDAEVVKFQVRDTKKFKIPHMGWNTIEPVKESFLLNNINPQSEFYFVHSYHASVRDETCKLTLTDYDYPFCSSFEKENIFGVQFHPEKSHGAGIMMLRNFVDLKE